MFDAKNLCQNLSMNKFCGLKGSWWSLVLGAIVAYCFVLWWPSRMLPYYWDGAMTTNTASHILLERKLWPLIVEYTDFAHPPLFNLLHLGFLHLFGDSMLAAHLLMLPFLPLYLISSLFIAMSLTRNRLTAMGIVTIIAFTPFVIAEYLYLYIDLPAATLGLLAVALQLKRRLLWASVFLVMAVLIKLTVLLLIPMMAYIHWTQRKDPKRINSWLFGSGFLWPSLISAAIWLIYHRIYTHWWLVIPGREQYSPDNVESMVASLSMVFNALFVDQSRIVLMVLGLLYLIKQPYNWWKQTTFRISLLALVSYMLAYAFMGEITYRYLLYCYPLAVLLVGLALEQLSLKPIQILGISLLISFIFFKSWYPQNYIRPQTYLIKPPEDFRAGDIIRLGLQTSIYIEENFPDTLVYGTYPESYQLSKAYHGYVKEDHAFAYCQDFEPRTILNDGVIVMIHQFSPLQPACADLVRRYASEKLKHFELNGLGVDVYALGTISKKG